MKLSIIQKQKIYRVVAAYLALNLLVEYTMPVAAYALTSGPAQEEFASFEPASTSDMVDLYSGDFNYNLPLLSVPGPNGGYPINLAYHGGIGMEQEASWVGLGWNVNVGAINRNLRGLPDDFAGEAVTTKNFIKTDWTFGLDVPTSGKKEVFGFPPASPPSSTPSVGVQLYYNNYRGMGARCMINVSGPGKKLLKDKFQLNSGLGITIDSQSGIGISPRFSATVQLAKIKTNIGGTYSASISSREGYQGSALSFDARSLEYSKPKGENEEAKLEEQSMLGGSTLSFGSRAEVPSVGMPMKNTSINFDLALSTRVTGFGTFETTELGHWSGSYNQTEPANGGIDTRAAYGTLNYGQGDDDENRLIDFQRSGITYSKKIPNLAPSMLTYDLFSFTGQGAGGMFRPVRTEAAVVSSPRKTTQTRSDEFIVEAGGPGTGAGNIHVGLGYTNGSGSQTSGKWVSSGLFNDDQTNIGGYNDLSTGAKLNQYEPWYFQLAGEKSGILATDDFLTKWGGSDEAYKIALTKSNDLDWSDRQFEATDKIGPNEPNPALYTIGTGTKAKPIRAARATNIEYYTVGEVLNANLTQVSDRVKIKNGYAAAAPVQNRAQLLAGRPQNQLAEISMLQADGMRYTYGLPAYNESQKDVTFILDKTAGYGQNTASVAIPSSQISGNAVSTTGIYNEFYTETNLPQYVHSWLLTSVVSADYVDITGNGPTGDDYGYWVKFNYTKADNLYSWRAPYHGVRYMDGNKNDPTDDMGSYTYGEKQLFYLNTIETKTHIAVFNLGNRRDSKEAVGDVNANSGTGAESMKRIDAIALYTKAEYTASPSTAVPIKTVKFAYDYSLCPNVKNNDGAVETVNSVNVNAAKGKLSLKQVWFEYLNSTRGSMSPYQFTYSTFNPAYNEGDMDRWGNYKPNSACYNTGEYPYFNYGSTDQLDYRTPAAPTQLDAAYTPGGPFANRSEELASAWALTSIRMPSGGTMDIEYELDDYSYNEDKQAMHFFDITDATGSDYRGKTSATLGTLTNTATAISGANNYRVYFKLDKPASAGEINSQAGATMINDKYVRGMTRLYFKTYMRLLNTNSENGPISWDYVSGWANLVNTITTSYMGVESANIGYITIEKEGLNELNLMNNTVGNNLPPYIHPFRKAAFQHLRANRSELLYTTVPYANNWKDKLANFIGSVGPLVNELITTTAGGFNNGALLKSYATDMRLDGHSVIRLYDHDNKKYGGGVRVKRLALNDHWVTDVAGNGAETETPSSYGQDYFYTMPDGSSSGVAYEPQIGREESALVQPIDYPLSTRIKNPDRLYLETPILEDYYPGAAVGYRRVIVKSIAPKEAKANSIDVPKSVAPISEYLFYSPKEFPVYTDETDLNDDVGIYRPIIVPGFYNGMVRRKARTQGYLVELNDMAGKPRMVATYTREFTPADGDEEIGKLISKVEYFYDTQAAFDPDGRNRLNNKVRIVKPGTNSTDPMIYQTGLIGQTEDVFVDMDEDLQRNKTIGGELNLDVFSTLTPLQLFLMPLITGSHFEASMRTVVTHKIVNRIGLLKETVVTTDESVISTKNLAYDLETAQPILTQVTNDYKDDIYNLAYPAHWYYPGMQGAYRNYRAQLDLTSGVLNVGANGRVTITGTNLPAGKTAQDFFEPGDEVYIDFTSTQPDGIYWIYKVGPNVSGGSYIDLMTSTGAFVPSGQTFKLIKVLRSGHRNMVSASAGGAAFRDMTGFTPYSSAAPASGTFTFAKILNASAVQYSDIWAADCFNCAGEWDNNPISNKIDNPYRIGILGNWRAYKSYAYRTQRSQSDDIREDGVYSAFNVFNWKNPSTSDANWIVANTVTMYSPHGFELENKDPLGNYSAATYEYNGSLATMVASNSRYREIGYDGFEDYVMSPNCVNYDHWGFGATNITSTEQHTGRYSLVLGNGGIATISSPVFTGTEYDALLDPLRMNQLTLNDNASTTYSVTTNKDCPGALRLTPGKTYVVSAWLKDVSSIPVAGWVNTGSNFVNGQIQIQSFVGGVWTTTQTITANDNTIIDGWQRLFGTFQVPSNATDVRIRLRNTSATVANSFFDDIRIHPFDGNAKTFVYDQTTLKLLAELDDNNFATFYNYDDEGHLIKVRKETKDGIKTIKEGRINTRSNY